MEYRIHTLLFRTAHLQQNCLRPSLAKVGLSHGQPKVLRCLYLLGPCSQRILADYCEADPASICRMLDSMERNGLLVRQPCQTDRRTDEIRLTEKGRRTLEQWEQECNTFEEQLLQGFSEEEKQQLQQMLARAYRNVGGRLL